MKLNRGDIVIANLESVNVLAGGAGFRVQYPLAILGAAGEGDKQAVAAFTDGNRQVLGAHLYKFQKE